MLQKISIKKAEPEFFLEFNSLHKHIKLHNYFQHW